MPSAAILRFKCLIARSMPLSPTWTSRDLHSTVSVGLDKGRLLSRIERDSASQKLTPFDRDIFEFWAYPPLTFFVAGKVIIVPARFCRCDTEPSVTPSRDYHGEPV